MCVCVGLNFEKFKLLNFRNCSADRVEIRCAPKADAAHSLISFSSKLIHGLAFYDDFNVFKNV